MQKSEAPFIGAAYTARSLNLNAQRCVNLYPVSTDGGKVPIALIGTPGMTSFSLPAAGEVRGMITFARRNIAVPSDDTVFAVIGATLYQVYSDGSSVSRGTLRYSTGIVSMASNGSQIMIVEGEPPLKPNKAWIWDGTTFSEITSTEFLGAAKVAQQDGYFIYIRPNTQQFYISALNDGKTWDSTDFSSADSHPDNLTAIISDHRELWLFGEKSTEVWYNSGDATFPFARVQGASIEKGCAAQNSPVAMDNTIYWLAQDELGGFQIIRAAGYSPEIISTRAIEYAIQGYAKTSDAIGYSYQQDGHSFYVLTFPTGNATWVFDAATGLWHERASFSSTAVPLQSVRSGTLHRHRGNCHVFCYGKHLIGDYETGRISYFDLGAYTDNGTTIPRIRSTQHIWSGRNMVRHAALQIEFEAGVGINSGQGSDPQAMLDWSDDGGHTFGHEHWRGIGKIGEYAARSLWNRLGSSRDRVYRVSITDPS